MKRTILLISKASLPVAKDLQEELADSEIVTTIEAPGCRQVASYEEFLRENFHQREAFIVVGAMGICVRLMAPLIRDKYTDPAVVCVDGVARYVIPVLSGHVGGANDLARQVAFILGAKPVITTLSDCEDLWALDTLGKRYGWGVYAWEMGVGVHWETQSDTFRRINRLIALFVNKEPTLLYAGALVPGVDELVRTAPEHVKVVYDMPTPEQQSNYKLMIWISPLSSEQLCIPTLQFIPRVLHLGIGLSRQAGPVEDVMISIMKELSRRGYAFESVKRMASIDLKKEEPVLKAFQQLGFKMEFYTADELAKVDVPSPSARVMAHVGTPSVCEAAAILSAGGGDLVLEKVKGRNFTVAMAVEPGVLRKQEGHVEIVGAGPGDPELISMRGRRMLERADLILYAGSLVPRELTFCAKEGALVRNSATMTLEEQCELMKKYYDRGCYVVRLHTGDPCIYGAIEEQMNFFDKHGMDYHITPGISSFQAAAAELQSQFTIPEKVQTIILTRGEGRTPMPEREKLHLLARSRSTMCIFLSASIADQVQEELLQEYPADTPVAVCYHLTWRDQRIWRGKLQDLAQIVRENKLTLTTMIVVGEAIGNREGTSRLYADDFKHLFRQ